MKMVPLSSICDINPPIPADLKNSRDMDVAFVPMSSLDVNGTFLDIEKRKISDVSKGYKYFEKGDVILAKITPCMENGKAAFVEDIPCQVAFGSTEFHVLRPKKDIYGKYLGYLVRDPRFRKIAEENMTGTAGQRRVPTSFLERYKIVLPPREEQIRIASLLSRIEELIAKRKESIRLLDEFVKSYFIKKFINKKHRTVRLDELSNKITDGEHKKPNYKQIGMPFISVGNITNGYLEFNNCKYISESDFNNFIKRCKPEINDILYTKVGATYGRAVIVETDKPFSLYVSVALIKPKVTTQL